MIISNKKGVERRYIIWGIIAALTIVILLFMFKSFLFPEEVNRNTCHLSIIERSTFNVGPIELGKNIPLQCETEIYCLTMSGEKCENLEKEKLEAQTIKLSSNPEIAKKEILEFYSELMYEHNSMLGEGILNFAPHGFTEDNYCLITAQTSYDKEAREKIGKISYGELYRYLNNKRTKDGRTYLSSIYPMWNDWQNSITLFEEMKKEKPEEMKGIEYSDWAINLNEGKDNVLLTQIVPEGTWDTWLGAGGAVVGVVAGVLLTATGIGAPIGVGLIGVSVAGGAVAGGAVVLYNHPAADSDNNFYYAPPTIMNYDVKTLKDLECTDFSLFP